MAKPKASCLVFLIIALASRLSGEGQREARFGLALTTTNDNRPYLYAEADGGIGLAFGKGPDNAFTMGLRLDAVLEVEAFPFDRFLFSASLNAFTSMDRTIPEAGGWRTDFLSAMLWAELSPAPGFDLGLGLGGEGAGDFGGDLVQNAAHRLFGNPGYSLSYRRGGAGPLAGLYARLGTRPGKGEKGPLSPYAAAMAIGDTAGVARSSLSLMGGLGLAAEPVEAGLEAGCRWSALGSAEWLAGLFSSRVFVSAWLGFKMGAWAFRMGMSLNPYGNRPSPEPCFEDVQNHEYFWSLGLGPCSLPSASWLFLP